jgi:type II secretion system protein N
MTEGRKRLLRWVGYPLLAVLSFVFAAHFTFPYQRVRERIVDALSGQFDVGVADVGPGWAPGRVRIEGLSLTTRPAREDEQPRTLFVERVDLAVGLMALAGKTVSVDIDALIGGGKLVGNVRRQDDETVAVDLRTEGLSLESIPGITAVTGGAPIVGPVEAEVKLSLPKGKWEAANGDIRLACSGCSIGDGKTKVRPMSPGQQNAFTSEGMTLPRIRLGELEASVDISKGAACVERFQARGGDVELSVEGGVKFADPFKESQTTLQARVKTSEEFRAASVRNAALFTGVRDASGFVTFQTRSPLLAMRWTEPRSSFLAMRECQGVAAPPPPPSRPQAGRVTPPVNPEPPAPQPQPEPPAPARGAAVEAPPPPAPEPAPEPAREEPPPVATDSGQQQPLEVDPPAPSEPAPIEPPPPAAEPPAVEE